MSTGSCDDATAAGGMPFSGLPLRRKAASAALLSERTRCTTEGAICVPRPLLPWQWAQAASYSTLPSCPLRVLQPSSRARAHSFRAVADMGLSSWRVGCLPAILAAYTSFLF